MIVVSNTSPITSLSAIGYVNLLHDIYGTIIIPSAVYEEMTHVGYAVPGTIEVTTLSWIEKRTLENRSLFEQLNHELHRGESETIALAIALGADRVIMDENPGRKKALSLGLNVIGVLGILLIAKRRGLITAIKPLMDDLISQAGFRINRALYLGSAEKVFRWGLGVGGWGLGVGVWGFTHFQVVNYLIFREKVPEFSPQSLQGAALFEGKKV